MMFHYNGQGANASGMNSLSFCYNKIGLLIQSRKRMCPAGTGRSGETMDSLILMVDDSVIADEIASGLAEAGYEITLVRHSAEGITQMVEKDIDLLLVDMDTDGTQPLIRETQLIFKPIPVFAMTTSGEADHIVECFDRGANDVIVRPFSYRIFLARIKNLLRMFSIIRSGEHPIHVGDLYIHVNNRQVLRNGQEVVLTPKEFDLLMYLALHVNQVCSRQHILKHVWKHDYISDTNVVDVYIRHLRIKIDKGHKYKMIRTERGIGYSLQMQVDTRSG